jgi:hypothetical protein
MKRSVILTTIILLATIASKSQNDTMYVFQDKNIIWQHAVSDIDSIIFYAADSNIHSPLPKITGFQNNTFIDENGDAFFPWGFNYTNPALVDLVEDYWMMEEAWTIIKKDFKEMKAYGANTVRIHLQYVKFMENTTTPDTVSFKRLERLVQISQDEGMYLIVTGLAAYRLSDAQPWYDELDDYYRWETQKLFWQTTAATLKDYSCVFAYDLINEPVVASGCHPDSSNCSWYPEGGQFGGYQFIQNISINPANTYWETIAFWTNQMTDAIRIEDDITMVTLGLLPLGPINSIASHFDILSTHIYPNTNDLMASINYVINNQSDKPFLIEEFYNLSCSAPELVIFLDQVDGYYHGLIGHYMGKTIEEYDTTILIDFVHKEFLEFFIENNPNLTKSQLELD